MGYVSVFRIVTSLAILCVAISVQGEEELLHRAKRVIGGETVSRGDHPWLVWLSGKIVTQRLFGVIPIRHHHVYCGGSLLNDGWILTAAHCFDGGPEARDVDAWKVRLASVDNKVALADRFMDLLGKTLGRNEWLLWEVDVTKIIIHPGYTQSDLWYQDIALVRLEERIPSGPGYPHIAPVTLPTPRKSTFPRRGDTCVMTGWGCTSAGGGVSRYAMSTELPIASSWACRTTFHPKSMFGRLCAGSYSGPDKGICPGDSGGPLVCMNEAGDWIQVGIASFTSQTRPEKSPAVFTRVSDYVDWINLYIH